MTNFIVIFVCLIAGNLCKKLRHFPSATPQVLNSFVVYLSLPALVFAQLPKLLVTMDFSGNWWMPVSMAWMAFAFSYLVFGFAGKQFGWKDSTTGALILTAGLGNTSFVGFPLLEALIGPHALPIGILADQPGSFLALATIGIFVAALYSGAKITPQFIARRILFFPPFIALLLSVFWYLLFGINHPHGLDPIIPAFEKVAATLVPLAVFSVGYQLHVDPAVFKRRWFPLMVGLGFRLLVLPAFFAFFYIKVLGGNDLITQVTVLESAMATMITAAVVANEFNLDNELTNLMVGVGIPISLITIPLWKYFLGF